MRNLSTASIILIIIFAGFALRINKISDESFWLDEGYSVMVSRLTPLNIIKECEKEVHPPFYYILLHYWIYLFGCSEFSTRILSSLFGSATLFMIFKIGSLLFNKNTGILACFLLSISLFHINYSQEVRSYALMTLLACLSYYFFIIFMRNCNLISIGYIISTVLLLFVHNFGFFIIISQNIYFFSLIILSKNKKLPFIKLLLLLFTLILLYFPYISVIIKQFSKVQKDFWIPYPSKFSIIDTFYKFSSNSFTLIFVFLILFIFSLISYEKIKGKFNSLNYFDSIESFIWKVNFAKVNEIYLLLLWITCLIFFPFIISVIFSPIYLDRATIPALIPFYLIIAKGIENIKNKYIYFLILIIILIPSIINISKYFNEKSKEQWREFSNYIESNATTSDIILLSPFIIKDWVFDYYFKNPYIRKIAFPTNKFDISQRDIEELPKIIEKYDRIWLVVRKYNSNNLKILYEELYKNLTLIKHKSFIGIELYLFQKNY